MRNDWSLQEVRLIVDNYFQMLMAEMRMESYNKAQNANFLIPKLNNRSNGSVEFKHANISAALRDLGLPYINGYQPRGNYQRLITDVITEYLSDNVDILAAMETYADFAPQASTEVPDPDVFVNPREKEHRPPARSKPRVPRKFDFAGRDERNQRLGKCGEEFVIGLEVKRLEKLGLGHLAERIEWTAREKGDGAGYDILSFDCDGGEVYIEVKTTNLGIQHPFYFSNNELQFSEEHADRYCLFRVFHFSTSPKVFVLRGALSKSCNFMPMTYRGFF